MCYMCTVPYAINGQDRFHSLFKRIVSSNYTNEEIEHSSKFFQGWKTWETALSNLPNPKDDVWPDMPSNEWEDYNPD